MSLSQPKLAAVVLLFFSFAATSASAQFPQQFNVDEYRPMLVAFAQCNVRKNPALAREFILTNRNYAPDERFRGLILPECLGEAMQREMLGFAQLQLTTPILWYIIADALVARDLQRFNPEIVRTAAPLPELAIDLPKMRIAKGHAATAAQTAQNLAVARNDLALVKYGECVVRADPHGSQRLLATKVNQKRRAPPSLHCFRPSAHVSTKVGNSAEAA
ncbi:MAG: hypothetical protein ACTHOI_04245 [Sphingomicrobium sp.]